ncbi:transcription termination factor Rho [Mycobacterium sherrisii]|uniref:Transcription termination factor Rho n=1 Tax=Mycobacterium sherrisii TaxID=243061 RepID=A0A1E3T3P8_9MYCO|nr:transcription termination factor Rho [Mycobacterium sherrisii]MCV7030634.1 transcription termination factor Rho [Mycobacterium sherrisii]MEC4762813.1 transcription termination factor Rho [Mycobacterium sherrisii]ODR09036.1 transcription termination factor Rho [Mycobacterium sherrisii]ORW77273.1 transcription termination factor Rho [Mycobacterium sherrisii]
MTDTDLFTADESTDGNQLSTAVTTDTPDVKSKASTGSLSTMVLPELRALASQAGVKGTSGMRKNELIAAIKEIRGQANGAAAAAAPTAGTDSDAGNTDQAKAEAPAAQGEQQDSAPEAAPRRERRAATRGAGSSGRGGEESDRANAQNRNGTAAEETDNRDRGPKENKSEDRGSDSGDQGGDQQGSGGQQGRGSNQQDDDGEGRQGRRGRRFRDRRRRGERSAEGGDTELREDDVVQPVAGILDVLDNYAFVRTSGYLAGPHDVYVSMNMVRKNGLRRGDAVTGAVRVPREGEQPNQRQKFNPLVRLDSVNGGPVEDAKKRPEFSKLTPLYPNQRLRLETTPDRLTTRVIDLIMPIGKGQRALIVSPPKAGKTTILQDIANAITKNNPECHLMVVLVDERPEEVTDMQRSVKGEVIASTFDRPPSDHTSVAELAIERAKRLVEQGKDVVVLLDSITRLGRAYNNASPASGRILSGGVDSTALYPPKRFLGAARNIEEGGSLTIIATAMVETGSTGDTVIFEEFKGTGNAELKLDRKISERRVFPAVDVNPSGTRKDELLLSPDEFGIVHKLRRVLSGLDSHQAIDLLMSQLRKTKTNYEFLVQVSKTTPGAMDND